MKTELTVNVRPLRHVYFVDSNDLKRFGEIVSLCCTQWGGINNLIVPIDLADKDDQALFGKDSFFSQLIASRNPNIFVKTFSSIKDNSFVENNLTNWLRSVYPDKALYEWSEFISTDRPVDQSAHALSITPPQPNLLQQSLSIAGFFPGESLSALEKTLLCTAFGQIWPGQESAYQGTYVLRPWHASALATNLHQQSFNNPFTSVINLTLKELQNIGTDGAFPSLHFDIVIAQTVMDLCWFWNLRALAFGHSWLNERRVLLLSKDQLLSQTETLIQFLKEKRSHPHINTNIDVLFHFQDKEIQKFLQSHSGFQHVQGQFKSTVHFRGSSSLALNEPVDDNALRPIAYMENAIAPFTINSYYDCGGHRPILLLNPENSTDNEVLLAPTAGPLISGTRRVNIDLQSDFWNQYPQHSAIARLIIPRASFGISLNTPYLSYEELNQGQHSGKISFAFPKTMKIYEAYFDSLGYEVFSSDKRFYADGVLRIANGIDKAQVLRSRAAYKILDGLADKSTGKLTREFIQQLNHLGFTLSEQVEGEVFQILLPNDILMPLKRNPHTFQNIKGLLDKKEVKDCLTTLEKLIEIQAIQRGFAVQCPHCKTPLWYGVGELNERLQCRGCLEEFLLPVAEGKVTRTDRTLQYVLNPLVNRAIEQAILPVLTTLLTLREIYPQMYHLVPGMSFKRKGETDISGDFDFIYTHRQRLIGGECKLGPLLTEKDINTARIAQQLGFHTFFFATAATFTSASKNLVKQYQEELKQSASGDPQTYNVFLLEEKELFGENPLPNIAL